MSGTLQGEVALVTGAGRGIGEAIARRLAAEGAAVCVADLDASAAAAVAASLSGAGAEVSAATLDVADPDSFTSVAAGVAERFGDLTILINNAGVVRPSMVYKMTDADWDLVHDVVLRGAFNGVRAVAPWFHDPATPRGRRIVNISSVAAYGGIGGSNYTAAKAGLIGFTKAIAHEWAHFGVTVNAVAPGFVDAGLSQAIPDRTRQQVIARIPAGRAGTADDIAAAVTFFCSPEAGFVTAQVLDVDGGMPDMRPR
jgi:3-oxoacyl-[acyl-carrier protein] reductase